VDEDEDTGPTHMYYRSDKILGLLYRAVDEKKIWFENIKFSGHRSVSVFNVLLKHIKSECSRRLREINWSRSITDKAWEIRHA
jgi:hypothetical protein